MSRNTSVLNSKNTKPNTKQIPVPMLKGDTVPLHLMTLSRDQDKTLEQLNMMYTMYTLSEMGIDDSFEDKEETARFFLDMATLIRFVYANFSE